MMNKLFAPLGVGFVALLLAGSAQPRALQTGALQPRALQPRALQTGALQTGASATEWGAESYDEGAADAPEELACCKVCHKGQACGDSCIPRKEKCHQETGCACDGEGGAVARKIYRLMRGKKSAFAAECVRDGFVGASAALKNSAGSMATVCDVASNWEQSVEGVI